MDTLIAFLFGGWVGSGLTLFLMAAIYSYRRED